MKFDTKMPINKGQNVHLAFKKCLSPVIKLGEEIKEYQQKSIDKLKVYL